MLVTTLFSSFGAELTSRFGVFLFVCLCYSKGSNVFLTLCPSCRQQPGESNCSERKNIRGIKIQRTESPFSPEKVCFCFVPA